MEAREGAVTADGAGSGSAGGASSDAAAGTAGRPSSTRTLNFTRWPSTCWIALRTCSLTLSAGLVRSLKRLASPTEVKAIVSTSPSSSAAGCAR